MRTTTFLAHSTWLRLADPSWVNPLDPKYSSVRGGRWTPLGGAPTLYLCANARTARAIVAQRFRTSPVRPEDLSDSRAPQLLTVEISAEIVAVDAVTDAGLRQLGLPAAYPVATSGELIGHDACQPIGAAAADRGLNGVYARSAATRDGSGRELAWFPGAQQATISRRDPYPAWAAYQ